jgi:transposase
MELGKINTNLKTLEEATEVIGQLVKVIIAQEKEIDSLHERLNNNSNNSSLPPSHDLKKKEKKKSDRKQGAKPGYKASLRVIVPAEEVNIVVDCKPSSHCECGGAIVLKDKMHIHHISAENRVTESLFICRRCRYKNHADVVGAINILRAGHAQLACGERVQLGRSMNQEPIEVTQAIA